MTNVPPSIRFPVLSPPFHALPDETHSYKKPTADDPFTMLVLRLVLDGDDGLELIIHDGFQDFRLSPKVVRHTTVCRGRSRSRTRIPRASTRRQPELPRLPAHQIQAAVVEPSGALDRLHGLVGHETRQAGCVAASDPRHQIRAGQHQPIAAVKVDLDMLHPRGDTHAKTVRQVGQQIFEALGAVEADSEGGKQGQHLGACPLTHTQKMQPVEPCDVLELENFGHEAGDWGWPTAPSRAPDAGDLVDHGSADRAQVYFEYFVRYDM